MTAVKKGFKKQKKDNQGKENPLQAEPLVEDPAEQQPPKTGKAMKAVQKDKNKKQGQPTKAVRPTKAVNKEIVEMPDPAAVHPAQPDSSLHWTVREYRRESGAAKGQLYHLFESPSGDVYRSLKHACTCGFEGWTTWLAKHSIVRMCAEDVA